MTDRPQIISAILHAAPPLPLSVGTWSAVVATLRLSPQEAKVAELVLRDLGDAQIAEVLGISEKTVATYLRERISRKTGTRGRMQLAMRVLALALDMCDCRNKESRCR